MCAHSEKVKRKVNERFEMCAFAKNFFVVISLEPRQTKLFSARNASVGVHIMLSVQYLETQKQR